MRLHRIWTQNEFYPIHWTRTSHKHFINYFIMNEINLSHFLLKICNWIQIILLVRVNIHDWFITSIHQTFIKIEHSLRCKNCTHRNDKLTLLFIKKRNFCTYSITPWFTLSMTSSNSSWLISLNEISLTSHQTPPPHLYLQTFFKRTNNSLTTPRFSVTTPKFLELFLRIYIVF